MSKQITTKAIRNGFGDALLKLGDDYPEIVALCADLTPSVKMADFEARYPERFFQTGIAEQNMAGIAAGLALSGKVPYMGSFSSFQPMRNLDQIRSSICIMNLGVKIVSSHAGFSHAADGIQVQALEDVGIMRMLPNMTVLVPGDYEQAYELTLQSFKTPGPVFIRLGREESQVLSSRGNKGELYPKVKIGEAQLLREGTDLVIFCMGYMVQVALDAALELAKQGISARVVNMHTVKPIDEAEVLSAAQMGRIISIEEHQQAGGLGSAIAEVLAGTGIPCVHEMIAVEDSFGETAKSNTELFQKFGLTVERVVEVGLQGRKG